MNRYRFEAELNALGLRAFEVPIDPNTSTLGFEFDMNYGLNTKVLQALQARGDIDAAVMPIREFDLVTKTEPLVTSHTETDGAGDLADGFTTKRDGPRIEISTTPFTIGKEKLFEALAENIRKFASELEAKAFAATADQAISIAGIRGHPVHFTHPKTKTTNYPLVIHEVGPLASRAWPPAKTPLFASPQATLTLPLGKVGMLIREIEKTKGGRAGEALTGAASQRLGLRTDLAVIAMQRVAASRKAVIGIELSDKSKLKAEDFTDAVAGLVTLLVMYLLTGEIVDPRDKVEQFAKGSLPLNLKTPFWQVYKSKSALTDRERLVFDDVYGKAGAPRTRLFKLVRRSATAADGARRLFPTRTHADLDRFHTSPLTWDMLVDHTMGGAPLVVTKDNTVPKKKHVKGDEILFAPLSSKIDFSKTNPCIAIELRRIGFAAVPWRKWVGLMRRVRGLAIRLNA